MLSVVPVFAFSLYNIVEQFLPFRNSNKVQRRMYCRDIRLFLPYKFVRLFRECDYARKPVLGTCAYYSSSVQVTVCIQVQVPENTLDTRQNQQIQNSRNLHILTFVSENHGNRYRLASFVFAERSSDSKDRVD
jgi:hypothetical protein